ncbi:alpha/beta fold hydrolase [Mucilaginibacter sp. FT3.2]|uniref:alpha/beta fold hydrolase n=1 Tax=Mucilaginibacter sp. FT3.2 TaxID=2723090 RepID=UPI0016193C79|nr:alpha/beta fold hydrolase [Mucilaginibacter sp. FT3.2]MBB6230083.1 pimeloyl-ACP methyl ester carboxylesterase [Mucilaginibacter sp. FT3.2]
MDFVLKEEHGFSYIDEGEGEVLLLLHGLMGSLSNWDGVVDQFKSKYRVIIPILPIYDMPLITTGVRSLSKFVHKFIKFKKLSNITVLGNSLGGHVALVYVLAHPENIKAMVLTGSSGLYENAFGGSFPRRESIDFVREKVQYTFYDPGIATDEMVTDIHKLINDRHSVLRLLAMAKSAIRHNMKKDLHKMDLPVCLIWGKDDKITPPEVAVEFSEELPNAELHWIDKCGHAPMMERPEEFNVLLGAFLEKLEKVEKIEA